MLGVDVIEHPERGYLLNEINHTLEFNTAAPATGVDIPGILVDYLLQVAKAMKFSPNEQGIFNN